MTSTCHWFITTGSTSVAFRMSPSGGTICCSCVPCCLCRWLSLWMGYCRQLRPALDRYVRLALRSWWESRPEGPDVPRDGCGRYMWWGHRLVTFRSSRFRIFGCTGGGGLRLSASVAPGVSGSEWYWSIVGSSYSGVNQCSCASP